MLGYLYGKRFGSKIDARELPRRKHATNNILLV
jgi:hypothetical protein